MAINANLLVIGSGQMDPKLVIGVMNSNLFAWVPNSFPSTWHVNLQDPGTLTNGVPVHVAFRRVGDTFTLEVDGSVVATTTYSGAIGPWNMPVTFLGAPYMGASSGIIDFVRITRGERPVAIPSSDYKTPPPVIPAAPDLGDGAILITFDGPFDPNAPEPPDYPELAALGNPVHYFPMNEGSGTTIEDLVTGGTGNIEDLGSNVTWDSDVIYDPAPGNSDSSLRLDNVAGQPRVTLPDAVTLVGMTEFSVELLIEPDQAGPEQNWVVLWLDGNLMVKIVNYGNPAIRIEYNTDSNGQAILDSYASLPDVTATPIHLVIDWDGSYLRAYANGLLWGKVAWTFAPERHSGFTVQQNCIGYPSEQGGQTIIASGYNGLINSLVIRDYSLTRQQILEHAQRVIDPNVIANYADVGAGFSLSGTYNLVPYSRYGFTGFPSGNGAPRALELGGDGEMYLDMELAGTDDFTIELRIQLNSISGDIPLIDNDDYRLGVNNGDLYFTDKVGSAGTINTTGDIEPNVWAHIAVRRTGGTTSVYLDDMVTPVGSSPDTTNYNTSIGSTVVTTGPSGGYIDSVRIQNASSYGLNDMNMPFPVNLGS